MSFRMVLLVRASVIALAVPGPLTAADVLRANWVPNNGERILDGELPLGDMWTFKCPRHGSFSVSVDTRAPSVGATSELDPLIEVIAGNGDVVAIGDDELECTYEPVCGFACPQVTEVACGSGETHSIVVRDFGADFDADSCDDGGGYELRLSVRTARGKNLSERSTDLGGSPRRTLPAWVAPSYDIGREGPLLDDEGVPNMETLAK